MTDVMTNAVIAAGCGALAAVAYSLATLRVPSGARSNSGAVVGYLAFVIVFGGLMAWDASR